MNWLRDKMSSGPKPQLMKENSHGSTDDLGGADKSGKFACGTRLTLKNGVEATVTAQEGVVIHIRYEDGRVAKITMKDVSGVA